jgi:hypothetical protein
MRSVRQALPATLTYLTQAISQVFVFDSASKEFVLFESIDTAWVEKFAYFQIGSESYLAGL